MNISRATSKDMDAINRLLFQVLTVHHEGRPDIFKPAFRKYTQNEFMELISLVRVGVARNIFDVEMERVNELIVGMQPATVNASEGKDLEPSQRDEIRAKIVRETLLKEREDDI